MLGKISQLSLFFLRSFLLRPGGVLLALTSPFTMDARSTAAREAIAARADLLTAVRLPTGTHQAMAGTEAVTDLLVLVRHDRDTPDPAAPWLATTPLHQAWPTLRPDQPPLHPFLAQVAIVGSYVAYSIAPLLTALLLWAALNPAGLKTLVADIRD